MLWNRSYQVNDKTPDVTSELKKIMCVTHYVR